MTHRKRRDGAPLVESRANPLGMIQVSFTLVKHDELARTVSIVPCSDSGPRATALRNHPIESRKLHVAHRIGAPVTFATEHFISSLVVKRSLCSHDPSGVGRWRNRFLSLEILCDR